MWGKLLTLSPTLKTRALLGSNLKSEVGFVAIQAAMGHSALITTSRYLHARPASEQAAAFTRAFEPTVSEALPA